MSRIIATSDAAALLVQAALAYQLVDCLARLKRGVELYEEAGQSSPSPRLLRISFSTRSSLVRIKLLAYEP
jgi:hypothetical protein